MTKPEQGRIPESERRLRHNFRLARLLRFLELVTGRGQWHPRNLMQELEVSERTVHRLRETLELAGVPLFFSKEDNAYRVRPDYRFPHLHLTDEEAIGQANATVLSESEALCLPVGSKATARKLGETGSEETRQILEDVTRLTQVLDLKIAGSGPQGGTIKTVQWALLQRKMLAGKYRSPYEPKAITFKLHPYRLALIKQAWYLVARPDDREELRTFRVVRFQTLKLVDRAARVPDDFDLKRYLGNAWAVLRGDERYDVELRFTADASDVVCETMWHHTQRVKWHGNGEVTLKFTVDGLNEILRWVVGWAGRVRVVKPVELRNRVVECHGQAVELNREEH